MFKDDLISEFGSEARQRRHQEDDLQLSVFEFLKWVLPEDAKAWHVPNGGKRSPREAARMVRLGVVPGIPDVHVLYRGRLHCIELKAPKGTVTELQMQVIERLDRCGARTAICRSLEAVERMLRLWEIPISGKLS